MPRFTRPGGPRVRFGNRAPSAKAAAPITMRTPADTWAELVENFISAVAGPPGSRTREVFDSKTLPRRDAPGGYAADLRYAKVAYVLLQARAKVRRSGLARGAALLELELELGCLSEVAWETMRALLRQEGWLPSSAEMAEAIESIQRWAEAQR